MIEELTLEWIVYHDIGFDFWASVKRSKRLLLHDLCNNSSKGSSGSEGGRVSE
jgi:hypothetical protein